MFKVKTNPLLMWSIGVIVGYWAFGLLLPGPWLSAVVSACLLVIGATVMGTSVQAAAKVIREGEVGPGELAVIGVFVLASGSFYSGGFGVLWSLANNPPSWTGTVYSSFGRAMMVVGFSLVFLSPDATREGIRAPRWYVLAIAIVTVAAIAFFLGAQFGEEQLLPKVVLR